MRKIAKKRTLLKLKVKRNEKMRSELDFVLKELAQYIIYGEENIKNAYKEEKIIQLDKNITDINKVYKKFQRIEKDNY